MTDLILALCFTAYAVLLVLIWERSRAKFRCWQAASNAAYAAHNYWWQERERIVGAYHAAAAEPFNERRFTEAREAARLWLSENPEPSVAVTV